MTIKFVKISHYNSNLLLPITEFLKYLIKRHLVWCNYLTVRFEVLGSELYKTRFLDVYISNSRIGPVHPDHTLSCITKLLKLYIKSTPLSKCHKRDWILILIWSRDVCFVFNTKNYLIQPLLPLLNTAQSHRWKK